MFDQIKKLQELKKLQDSFKNTTETFEKDGTSITLNGNFEVLEVKLNPQLSVDQQQDVLKQCFNTARENIQKKLAKTMIGSGLGF